MTEIEIYDTGAKAQIPSSWDEMTASQVLYAFRIYSDCVGRGGSPLEFQILMLHHFLGISRPSASRLFWARIPEMEERICENTAMLCDRCMSFLLDVDDKSLQCRLSFDSVDNPLPRVRMKCRLTHLYGPASLLQDLTFGEFRHASVALQTFLRTAKESDLNECIAFLYRRKSRHPNRAGRYVPDIDNGNIEAAARDASRLEPWQKNIIILWFASCLKYLQSGIVDIDGESVELSRLFASGDGATLGGYSFGWSDLAVQIAKDNVVGSIERVDEEPLFSILGIMWHNFKEQKQYEAISKAHKTK